MVKILLRRAEGPRTGDIGIWKEFDSIQEANRQLWRWSFTAPERGQGYDKVDFKIEENSKEIFGGRLDITKSGDDTNIERHLQNFTKYLKSDSVKTYIDKEDIRKGRRAANQALNAINVGQGGFFRHPREHSENAITGARTRVKNIDRRFRSKKITSPDDPRVEKLLGKPILIPLRNQKFKRIRTVDVGRPGHHKILIGVTGKKGPHGGTTEKIGGLREYKSISLKERLRRAEQLSNKVEKRVRG